MSLLKSSDKRKNYFVSTFMCEAIKLKTQQKCIEKNINNCLISLKHILPTDIFELHTQLHENRLKNEKELANKVKFLINAKNIFKNEVLDTEKLRELDINHYKGRILEIEKLIPNLKNENKTALEKYSSTEENLYKDITSFSKLLESWNKSENKINTNFKVSQYVKHKENIQEAETFKTFLLDSGGHEGGWPTEDHNLFLKLHRKYKHPGRLIQELKKILPDLSEENITCHYEWFKKYIELKKRQKIAIQEWRDMKNATKTKTKNINSKSDSELNIKPVKYRREQTIDLKSQLKVWKDEKLNRIKENELFRQQQNIKSKQIDKLRNIQNKEKKRKVDEWKSAKYAEEQVAKLEQEIQDLRELRVRKSQANKLIKEFQRQDLVYIKRKIDVLTSKNTTKDTNSVQNPHPSVNVTRDPNRVLRATKQWIARTKPTEVLDSNFFSYVHLRNIPKLAVPIWRNSTSGEA